MNFKEKMLDFKNRLTDRHMFSIVIVVTLVIAGFGMYEYNRSVGFKRQVEAAYQRSFTELVDYVDNIDSTLTKTMVTNNPNQLASLASDLWREAAFAKANLGQLPLSSTELDNTSNYLSQVGDYTYALSKKVLNNQKLTDQEIQQLKSLVDYSGQLNENLQNMENSMLNGALKFTGFNKSKYKSVDDGGQSIGANMQEVEKKFADYASLIYDGPFSQHVLNKEPIMVKDAPEISVEDAKKVAQEFLVDKNYSVEPNGESEGNIPTFNFVVTTDEKGREISVEVTKKGGYVRMLLDNKNVTNTVIDVNEASRRAGEFLQLKGFHNMKETGYIISGNAVDFAFAYVQDDYVIYTDLIKVKVALDNGDITGFEAHGYLTNHSDKRQLSKKPVSEEEATKEIKDGIEVEQVTKCLIPLETGEDVFCYEFKTKLNDKTFLIYINIENRREEEILLLVESETGALTI